MKLVIQNYINTHHSL